MMQILKRLWADRRGVTAMEFGLIVPILSLLAVGTVEFGRTLLLSQKLQNGTFALADLAARDETLSEEQLGNIFLAFNNVIQPFEFAESGTAIVSSITADSGGDPIVNWQRIGSGTLDVASEIGGVGGQADLPDTLPLNPGDTIITAEVYFDFVPIFGVTASPQMFRRVAYAKPRLGTLDTLAP